MLADAGNCTLAADTMLSDVGNSTLAADRMLATSNNDKLAEKSIKRNNSRENPHNSTYF